MKMNHFNKHSAFSYLFVACLSVHLFSCSEIKSSEEGCALSGLSEKQKNLVSALLSANCLEESKTWSFSNVSQASNTSRDQEITKIWSGFTLALKSELIGDKPAIKYEATLPENIGKASDEKIANVWPSSGYIIIEEDGEEENVIIIKRFDKDKNEDKSFSSGKISVPDSSLLINFTISDPPARSLGVANGQWSFRLSSKN